MDIIEKYIKTNYHTVLDCQRQNNRIIITTIFGEVINIGKYINPDNPSKNDMYEIFITTISGNECDYQSYIFNIYDLFRLLDLFVNNFYRGLDITLEYILDSKMGDNDEL